MTARMMSSMKIMTKPPLGGGYLGGLPGVNLEVALCSGDPMVGVLVAPLHHHTGVPLLGQPAGADADTAFVIGSKKGLEAVYLLEGDTVFTAVTLVAA